MLRATDTAPVTPTEMLARVRTTRAAAIAAEADLLVLAAEWADAHPDLDHDPDDPDAERGIPGWLWSASAPFAAALGRSTASGEALIRDALVLRHRLPSIWRRLIALEVESWRARRIAQSVLGAPDDVCAPTWTTSWHRSPPPSARRSWSGCSTKRCCGCIPRSASWPSSRPSTGVTPPSTPGPSTTAGSPT